MGLNYLLRDSKLESIVSRRINIVNNPAVIQLELLDLAQEEILFQKIQKYREQLELLIQSLGKKFTMILLEQRFQLSLIWRLLSSNFNAKIL